MAASKRAKAKPAAGSKHSPPAPTERLWRRTAQWLPGGVAAILVLRPLYPSESVAVEGDGLVVVMLWLILLALWAMAVIRGQIRHAHLGWPDLALGLLALWHTLSAVRAVFFGSPRPALNMLWEWLGLAVAWFLVRQSFRSGLERRAVAAVMIAVAATVSVYGLYQVAIELPATRAFYERASDEMLQEAGLWFPPGSVQRQVFEQRLASREPLATFALTNSLGGFLAPWSIVVLGIVLAYYGGMGRNARSAVGALLAPLGLCLLLTKSRSAYVAVGAATLFLCGLWWSGRSHSTVSVRRGLMAAGLVVVILAAGVAGAVALGGLDVEVLSEAPKSLGYRVQYWRSTWAMIREAPVFGCGPGNFQEWYTAYKLPEASEEIADPHNFLLEVWATAGSPAVVFLCGFLGVFALCGLPERAASAGRRAGSSREVSDTGGTQTTPTATSPPASGTRPIYVGALVGLALLMPIGAMSAAPPSLVVPAMGLLVGGGVVVLLRSWVRSGEETAALWTVGALALLIHLLFAGGIGFPGVATSLWLLFALALNARECGSREARPAAGSCGLLLAAGLIAGCFLTGYGPAVKVQTELRRAYADPDHAGEALLAAAEADRWAAEPRGLLADLVYRQWLRQPNDEAFSRFERLVEDTLRRAPRAASRRHDFGQRFVEAYKVTGAPEQLAKGVEALEAAVSLYPNNCCFRADLAEAYRLAGDKIGYERERKEALRLDRATPHLDKKLPREQRHRLERNDPV